MRTNWINWTVIVLSFRKFSKLLNVCTSLSGLTQIAMPTLIDFPELCIYAILSFGINLMKYIELFEAYLEIRINLMWKRVFS